MRHSTRILPLALLALVASQAGAQPDVNYHPCEFKFGVVSSDNLTTFELPHWGGCFGYLPPHYEYRQNETFYIHLILLSSLTVSAYEVRCDGLPDSGFVAEWVPIPGSGWLNLGSMFNHIAVFGYPMPNPDGVVHFGSWSVLPLVGDVEFGIQLRPSTPSSIQGDGPAIVSGGQLYRTDYTVPEAFTGCYEPTPPGAYPDHVAWFYPGSVATAAPSLTRVKALFR